MKRIISYILLGLLILSSFLISGCLPPNYTKDKAKAIAKEHHKDAVAWFKQNKPEAKVDSDCEAYSTGIDLLGAVKGEYKLKDKTYKYVYDYKDNKMYVSEGYEQVCALVKKSLLKEFGYAEKDTEISFHGYTFSASNENDDPKRGGPGNPPKPTDKIGSHQEKLIPASKSVEDFAQEVLKADTKESFPVYIHLWQLDFPPYEPNKLRAHKNLGSIWCTVPIDCEKGFNGVYCKVYYKDKIKNDIAHIDKIEDGLYGGYISSKEVAQDILKIVKKDRKSFRMEIPPAAQPIFFSKAPRNLVHYFKNTKGNLIQNQKRDVYRSACPGQKDYYRFGTNLMVKNNVSDCYDSITVSLVRGKYDYKLLSIFDLDYWMLKFFD